MNFGVVLPQHEATLEDLVDAAVLAEGAGLHSVWLIDHLEGRPDRSRPLLECWTSLAVVAAVTSRIIVGTMISRVGLRPPALMGIMSNTASRITGGRFTLALGLGDDSVKEEQRAYGVQMEAPSRRAALLEEAIASARLYAPGVPVWVGGGRADVLEIARRADGWNYWGPIETFEDLAPRLVSPKPGVISWGGEMVTREQVERAGAAGARHVVVPLGRKSYRSRIEQLSEWD